MPKVFVDDNEPKVEMVVEEVKAKPKRKRKPLTDEQKKALVERLTLARAAKKLARSVKQEKKPVVSEVEKVDEPKAVVNSVPVPKPIRKNLANKGNIWNMIRNS